MFWTLHRFIFLSFFLEIYCADQSKPVRSLLLFCIFQNVHFEDVYWFSLIESQQWTRLSLLDLAHNGVPLIQWRHRAIGSDVAGTNRSGACASDVCVCAMSKCLQVGVSHIPCRGVGRGRWGHLVRRGQLRWDCAWTGRVSGRIMKPRHRSLSRQTKTIIPVKHDG